MPAKVGPAASSSEPQTPGGGAEDIEADIAASITQELIAFDGGRSATTPTPDNESLLSGGDGYVTWVPALDPELRRTLSMGVRYWRLDESKRPSPRVLPANKHPDTWHLRDFDTPPDGGFTVDAALLHALAVANAFSLPKADITLFGLRGAMLPEGVTATSWASEHDLAIAETDHVERRCVMGVWRTTDDKMRLFSASTVPQIANMYAVLDTKGWGASLLPTGLYSYLSGTHNRGTERPQRGAARIQGKYVVLRATQATGPLGGDKSIAYDPYEVYNAWTFGSAHNIHSAGSGNYWPRFDSSGCQVVRGGYVADRSKGTGDWLSFQQSAGLADAQTGAPAADRRRYSYMLLTGRDAWLRYHGDKAFIRAYTRLRPGSRGERVLALRTALAKQQKKVLGLDTPAPGPTFDAITSFLVLDAYRRMEGARERVGVVWKE